MFKKYTVLCLIFFWFLSPLSAIAGDSAGPAGNERPKSEAIISSGEDTDSTPEMETESLTTLLLGLLGLGAFLRDRGLAPQVVLFHDRELASC